MSSIKYTFLFGDSQMDRKPYLTQKKKKKKRFLEQEWKTNFLFFKLKICEV
jgi:hypothetical protein